jgi:hypothetical protein
LRTYELVERCCTCALAGFGNILTVLSVNVFVSCIYLLFTTCFEMLWGVFCNSV